ncbi:MAG: DUF2336 domain-containing protein [Xanthobacteraceae bacterium]|nr:DUF2336 domain-containing protein [Xanthobacteraceae bacterium]
MTAPVSLLPELDEIVRRGSAEKRSMAVERIADLFLQGAPVFNAQHVELFDDVLSGLVSSATAATRASLADRLADLGNAPPGVINFLAREDAIKIAGPVLSRSPLVAETVLLDIAQAKGQPHLAAIAERTMLPTPLTDVILRRADRDVVRILARNDGAAFSEGGYSGLVKRAVDDGMLALSLGQREDISPENLKQLLAKSADIVRRSMFDTAQPKRRMAINKAMVEIVAAPRMRGVKRNFVLAQQAVLKLHNRGQLNEAALLVFAKEHAYEESIAALSAMTGIELATLDRLVLGDRHDPILLIAKAAGFGWATARALIALRLGPGKVSAPADIEEARINFERLSIVTAQRVLAFWRSRAKND